MKRWLFGLLLALFAVTAYAQQYPYPPGAIPFVQNATGTTTATLTITPSATQRVWLCGLVSSSWAGTGQTALGSITNMTGPTGAAVTVNFLQAGPMSATSAASYINDWIPCAPAVVGQAVVVTSPTSTAALFTALTVQGYFQ